LIVIYDFLPIAFWGNLGQDSTQSKLGGKFCDKTWKTVIGPKLKARRFENQHTEVKISVAILNQMTELGRPVFEQIA